MALSYLPPPFSLKGSALTPASANSKMLEMAVLLIMKIRGIEIMVFFFGLALAQQEI